MDTKETAGSHLRPVIFGEVLFDRFPDGTVVLGGAPFNVAWSLQAFGLQPLFISSIGADALGQQVRASMQAWGMDLSGLQTSQQYPTGAVDVTFHQGEPHYHIVPDSAWDFIQPQQLPALPANCLLYHGSLALRQPVSRSAWECLRRQAGTRRFIDINLRAPWWSRETVLLMLEGVQWLKINADELTQLAPPTASLDERIRQLFCSLPLEWLVVTQGEAGALAVSNQNERWQVRPQLAGQVVDTVGAGDSFSSVLITGLLHGWPMEQTLQRAQQFASAVVGLRGATTQNRDFYRAFIEDWGEG
ncbi:MAG: carbohydrate kinase [Gammaproteobacteria bacterium]|nr:carbohydrate kinase [Gammaproteobacteria bacterium]MBU1724575.1 carbohydrate kinase [Gammaproteobacteria bacterium]MBU2004618.1 carbohydrate kinase [Gammaproteobacteria bacterium]